MILRAGSAEPIAVRGVWDRVKWSVCAALRWSVFGVRRASGWSVRRVGLAPTGKRRLVTAHTLSRHYDFAEVDLISGRG